jgi:hypothetical protein
VTTQGKGRRSIVGSTIIVKGYRRDSSDFAQTFKVHRQIPRSAILELKSRSGCLYHLVNKRLERNRPWRLCASDCWIELAIPADSFRRVVKRNDR